MRTEERLIKFISDLLSLIMENMWGVIFFIWVATSILGLDELVMVKKESASATQQVEKTDGPKPSF